MYWLPPTANSRFAIYICRPPADHADHTSTLGTLQNRTRGICETPPRQRTPRLACSGTCRTFCYNVCTYSLSHTYKERCSLLDRTSTKPWRLTEAIHTSHCCRARTPCHVSLSLYCVFLYTKTRTLRRVYTRACAARSWASRSSLACPVTETLTDGSWTAGDGGGSGQCLRCV